VKFEQEAMMLESIDPTAQIPNDEAQTSSALSEGLSGDAPMRGPVTMLDGRVCIGKVAAPPRQEATSEQFHFWVPEGALVEKTQIVTCESELAGRQITFYAIVDEVRRQSGKNSMSHEVNEADGDLSYEPPFASEGFTYATASILRTEPPTLAPPRERSDVMIGEADEARRAYGADKIENRLTVGIVKNGGDRTAGSGVIDLDYLLGQNGGHLNVNGTAGRGTKSSFLLFTIYQLLREARLRAADRPSDPNPLMIAPIILNVKNYDLFFIDQRSRRFNPDKHLADWRAIGVDDPQPFQNVIFYAPQMPGGNIAVATGRDGTRAYSWSLADVIERGLLPYLFADEDTSNDNFSALLLDLEAWLTDEKTENDGAVTRRLRSGTGIQTFQELLDWVSVKDNRESLPGHAAGTWLKFRRRLLKLVLEGNGVLRRFDRNGAPLDVVTAETRDPIVIDLNALARTPSLQRFVAATILRQLIEARTGAQAVSGLVYLVALDELNRFAPRGSRDPITRLIENVAAEMRSQGIILLGAQQQASKVSETVIENSAIRTLGCSGSLELSQPIWRFLSDSARRKAATLPVTEKLIMQDNFREPMQVRVPFPVWAMRREEVLIEPSTSPQGDIADY
jgi:DNA helicase HerA-like ATPase